MSDVLVDGVAGALGAVIGLTATYPLLTVCTLQSCEGKRSDSNDGGSTLEGSRALLLGPVQDVIRTIRRSGWQSLYAGLDSAIGATAVSQGIYFMVYSYLRDLAVARKVAQQGRAQQPLNTHAEGIGLGASLLVASVAGWTNVLATNPLWVVVTQRQAAARGTGGDEGGGPPGRPQAGWAVAKQIWRISGWLGFYKGVWPSLVMVINPTLQFFFYEWLVARFLELRRARAPGGCGGSKPAPLGVLDVFLLSALAKLGSTLVTYPMLVVKNRLQAMNEDTHQHLQYTGVMDAMRRILRTEGVPGFYRGMKMKMVQTVLGAALLMAAKEQIYTATKLALQGRQGAMQPARAAARTGRGR